MDFPGRFENLPLYAFPRLRELLDGIKPGGREISMTIGEPKHSFPEWVTDIIVKNAKGFNDYPSNEGIPELKEAIVGWVQRRYGVSLDTQNNILALNGTREGLYNSLIALCPEKKNNSRPVVLIPNPFYQVYMASSLTVNAEPYFVEAKPENNHLPDFSEVPKEVLRRTAGVYLCSPSNPQGAIATIEYWIELIKLAEEYDFKIFADECYSEIYRGTPPIGGLEACAQLNGNMDNVLVLHSLSKRSSAPGLRCGFVAGDPRLIDLYRTIRSYAAVAVPLPILAAGEALWRDEAHVDINRAHYRRLFTAAEEILGHINGFSNPPGGFYLWLDVDDGEATALKLWSEAGVKCMPGGYMAQNDPFTGVNPVSQYLRVCLVHDKVTAVEALERISVVLQG